MKWEDIKWHDETARSRWALAVFFLAIIPGITFYFGMQYEFTVLTTPVPTANTQDQYTDLQADKDLQQAQDYIDTYVPPSSDAMQEVTFMTMTEGPNADVVARRPIFDSEGNVLTSNGFTFALPKSWKVVNAYSDNGFSNITLRLSNAHLIDVDCPPKPRGAEDYSILLEKNRSFIKNGVTYNVNYQEWGYNVSELPATESDTLLYFYTASKNDPDDYCLVSGGIEDKNTLEGIYNSWK